jgi:hypothetical protein
VLEKIIKEGSTYFQRGDANVAYEMITSFKFIFILHLMGEIMGTISGGDIGGGLGAGAPSKKRRSNF